jgi:O-antigen/teichoic acid export membrane protein
MTDAATRGPSGDPVDILDSPSAGGAVIRGGAVRIAAYVAGVVLSVGSAALLFRHLGVVTSGRYVTVVSLIAIAQGLTEAGITALGVRELAARPAEERERLLRAITGLRLLLTGAGVLVAVAFAALAGYGATLTLGTAIAGVGLMISNHQATIAIALQARLELVWVAAADLLRQVLTVVAIVALVVAGARVLPFFAIPILASGAALIYTARKVGSDSALRPSLDPAEWRRLLRDTLPFAVATAVYSLYFRIAVIVLSLVASTDEVGYFGAAFRIIEVLIAIPALAVGAVFPVLARAGRDDHARLAHGVDRTFSAALGFGGAIAVGLCAGAPFAIDVVAGPDFRPAVPVLRILSIALAAAFVTQVFGFALLSLHRHAAILVVSLSSLAAAGGLTVVLASSHGAEGAAVAVAVGEVVAAIGCGIAFTRALPGARLPVAAVARVVLAAAAGLAAMAIPGLPSVVAAVLAGAIYAVVLWAIGGIPREILDEAARRLRRQSRSSTSR